MAQSLPQRALRTERRTKEKAQSQFVFGYFSLILKNLPREDMLHDSLCTSWSCSSSLNVLMIPRYSSYCTWTLWQLIVHFEPLSSLSPLCEFSTQLIVASRQIERNALMFKRISMKQFIWLQRSSRPFNSLYFCNVIWNAVAFRKVLGFMLLGLPPPPF